MSEKQCIKCKEVKNLDKFYKNRNSTTSMCKICTKANNKKYFNIPKNKRKHRERQWKKAGIKNMTYEIYEEMLVQQDNRCKICGVHNDELSISLSVDHNHETGEIRSLLCKRCNYSLGTILEDVTYLQKLIDYLQKVPENDCF